MPTKIGIIGERLKESPSQLSLNSSLEFLKDEYDINYEWVDTTAVECNVGILEKYSGLWSAPGGKFISTKGALLAIQYARENDIPHLATCGGFQHTVMEIARNVLGIENASHEEYEPTLSHHVITRMACSLRGKTGDVFIERSSLAYEIYRTNNVQEEFLCSFGVNPLFKYKFEQAPFKISGYGPDGEIRILEIPNNRFFMATLFVPQTRSYKGKTHPVIERFVKTVCSS